MFPLQLIIPLVGYRHHHRAARLHSTARGLASALLAVVQNKDAARLMGIDVRRRHCSARLRCRPLLAGLAGVLIAPLFSVHSDMGTLFGIKAFAVAILGGITPRRGVMLAGLLYGLIEALVTAFAGSTYTQIVALLAWSFVALAAMPERAVRSRRGEKGLVMQPRARAGRR